MKIGELAQQSGVSIDALRLYGARGLIRSERRTNNYRDFPEVMLDVVRLIRLGQRLGFTLTEIAEVLTGLGGGLPAEEVRTLLSQRIAAVDERIVGSANCEACS